MATNKDVRDSIVLVAVIAALAVTIMANLLADRKFVRADLTAEGKYSLSAPFQNILANLETEEPAKVTYYVSGQVPGWFETHKRDILDKLNEVKTAAHGKIELDVVDPTENKELSERLAKSGAQFQVGTVEKDVQTVSILYSGMEISYQAKAKILVPAVGSAEEVEYLLGSKIMELTLKKKPIVAVMAPAAGQQMQMMGRQPQGSGYEWLQQGAWDDAKKFDVRPIDLTENNTIPADTALLIMIRPKELNERQRYEVVKYLAGGGKMLLIASPYKVAHEFVWRADRTPTGLEDYLKEVGLTFGADFICDNSNMRMLKSVNLFTGKKEYSKNPFFIKILAENIDQESVLTRLMPGLLMPSPAEIKVNAETVKKAGLKDEVLAKTSKQSWTVPFMESVNPEREARYDEGTKMYEGSKNVFVMLEGQFPFPYEGKPAPEWKSLEGPAKDSKPETASVKKGPGTLILCSSPEAFHEMYLSDETVGQFMQANAALVVNIAESVSMGDDLIKLRTKRYEGRSINRLTGTENDKKRNALKMGLIVGMPCLVIIFALLRVGLRRATQTRYERKFAETTGPSSFTP